MKNYLFFVTIPFILFFVGCASMAEPSYDSFSYRDSTFNQTSVTISEKGLTQEQINGILATQFPPEKTVSLSLIFLSDYNSYNADNNGLPYYMMNQGRNIHNVEKFVPIPRIFIPQNLTFDIIQDLGIRSLCEYTLIFYNTSNRSMTFSQMIHGVFKFESDIEFLLIDNQTTAIIASDRLYSSVIKKRQILSDEDTEEAENEIYTLQANLLAEKLNMLFSR